ncbi:MULTISPECIES: RHS repeat-associated core domain-containing protein [unclassified Pseudomonas]|uniref:RHS repeat-associated core domain-containing protein n=1 Tax=unclassified Pseudomonas TaxID=196821 RepID=UPI0024481903|nr:MULTISPECIES: RHS repeat-associated core domain-containing protein [unclassified Pseudomonas]MDH0301658.1 RHS repeat protein [Pseudomonas sp. GD04091]MDH1984877.1 RHS repeat protein [Pseudomonas sp. GD03689]
MSSTDLSLHQGTPAVIVRDTRGLGIREIAFHRHPDTPALVDLRITRQRFDDLGHLASSIDPRLHGSGAANLTLHAALGGEVLRADSVDAGRTLGLSDIDGRALIRINASGVSQRSWYEAAPLPGRLLGIDELVGGQAPRITERFIWQGNDQAAKDRNQAGMPVRHYDTAGCMLQDSTGLSGASLSSTRRLLADGHAANWQGQDESAWEALLAPAAFTTMSHADATGTLLQRTDAKGHKRRSRYDVAGRLCQSWLTLGSGTERCVLRSAAYCAEGRKLREEQGNGVVVTYAYEPRTQRLVGIRTARPAGHRSGAKVLQDLRYDYDPVGNVLSVRNDAQATRFWHNRKVVPESHYRYDSLYQLVHASGRELAGIARQGQHLPCATIPLPASDGAYTHYTRGYQYDRGGNLTRISHRSPAPDTGYTLDMTVSERSNRAVPSTLTDDPATVDNFFFAPGGQRYLQPGQPLRWTHRDELAQVVQVARAASAGDDETYRYDAASQRVEKLGHRHSSNTVQQQRTLYLPLLELQTRYNGETLAEALHVVLHDDAGGAQVRGLHWEHGMPDGLSNDALRYSHGDLIASAGLELDDDGLVISQEEYYPFGGTSVWAARNQLEARYKTARYAGKERDATGLYYYGYRYYQPWAGRWLSADPAGTIDGLNLYRMVRNNPLTLTDATGLSPVNGGRQHSPDERAQLKSVREEYSQTYKALKSASGVLQKATNEVGNFLDSKSTTIAYSTVSMAVTEVTGSIFGALGSAAGAVAGPGGAFILGFLAKEAAKQISPAYGPVPGTSISKSLNKNKQSYWQIVKETLAHQFERSHLRDKGIDKAGNYAIGQGLEALGSASSPISVPVTWWYHTGKKIQQAANLSKDDLVQEFSAEVDAAEKLIEGYISTIEDAFDKHGIVVRGKNVFVDPTNKHAAHEGRALVIDFRLLKDNLMRETSFESHRQEARSEIRKARDLIRQYEQRKQ